MGDAVSGSHRACTNHSGLEQFRQDQHILYMAVRLELHCERTTRRLLKLPAQFCLGLSADALLPRAQLSLPGLAGYVLLERRLATLDAVCSVRFDQLVTRAAQHVADGHRSPAPKKPYQSCVPGWQNWQSGLWNSKPDPVTQQLSEQASPTWQRTLHACKVGGASAWLAGCAVDSTLPARHPHRHQPPPPRLCAPSATLACGISEAWYAACSSAERLSQWRTCPPPRACASAP